MHSTFEWLTVHEVAERLSKHLRSEVISIAYHYDQIFEMTIYRNGLKMTTHRSGDYLDVCEVPYLLGDVEGMIRVFDADLESQQIVDILKIKDIRQKVWDLETSFNISLENKSDWFEMLESEVKEIFVLI
ncbi:hypothetical protein OS242_06000 [Tumebacillus sp. DT12]|uniref:DUF1828 domain-containing protein n=1 Tax=Tumebacillus lacus TaxID=2995335 RepID=A0ABT3WXV7_9BACL|nr:hypothetical protein [Tumebacillus lacus]MCX7569508.1 hypothetical protein [Tumebacillus lacus]